MQKAESVEVLDIKVRELLFSRFTCFRLRLHVAIYRPDSFVLMLSYCANLKAIRYESTSLNRIVADKSHRVIVALVKFQDKSAVFLNHLDILFTFALPNLLSN